MNALQRCVIYLLNDLTALRVTRISSLRNVWPTSLSYFLKLNASQLCNYLQQSACYFFGFFSGNKKARRMCLLPKALATETINQIMTAM